MDKAAIDDRQACQAATDLIPMRFASQPPPLPPLLSRVQSPTPVGKVEYGIAGDALFARRHDRAEVIDASLLVPSRIISHVLRGTLDDVCPFVERGAGRT